MEITEEAVERGERGVGIFRPRDVVDEERRQLGKMSARGLALEAARMPAKPAPHRRRDGKRVAEAHLAELVERFSGVRLRRKHEATAFGRIERSVLEQACVAALHRPQLRKQNLRERIAIIVAEE